MEPELYREPEVVFHPRRLSENEYAHAIEGMIVVCVDVLFCDQATKSLYLLKRKAKPWSDWWFVGGRLLPGEDARVGMVRKIQSEIGLLLSEERLHFVSMNRYFFKERNQIPHNIGSDSLAYLFSVNLTQEEATLANTQIDPNEYESDVGFQKFSFKEIQSLGVHPAIFDAYKRIFSHE
ncbi:MAG: hypothetical protein UY04_C0022G0003 [Parcubacteria group bacterium GW2011_GWA2_47_7]|nr:MAG: hypothetical protein UY04_C0022G0003 [Parcubacteria group bacterium GW2011_GWA2_47_7]